MRSRLGVVHASERTAREGAAHSRSALDRPLAHAAELFVAVVSDEARLAGAFQRPCDVEATSTTNVDATPLLRRGSGGPAVRVGPGTVHVALALAHPGALTPCDEKRIVNRSVRPLLRALAKVGALAHFFGRDWVSVHHRPAAWVGFAHDATTRRTLFEAFVAVRTPFDAARRPSFLGKVPGSIDDILGRSVDPHVLAGAIVSAYGSVPDTETVVVALPDASLVGEELARDPPWEAARDEAIGTVGAGVDARGALRVGGDLLVSRDALARLEAAVSEAPDADVGRIVDATIGAPGVALDGVRSLTSVRDVILGARASRRA